MPATHRVVAPATRWFASHELRTALQAIRGGVELLLGGRARGLSAQDLDAVSLIAAAVGELERHVHGLAELWLLVEADLPAPDQLALGELLATPAVASTFRPAPALAAAADQLVVRVSADLVARAFAAFARHTRDAGDRSIELAEVTAEHVVLKLAMAPSMAGEGAIAWRLAEELCHRGGAGCTPVGGSTTLLTLPRASSGTI
jgi:hypothetical protein